MLKYGSSPEDYWHDRLLLGRLLCDLRDFFGGKMVFSDFLSRNSLDGFPEGNFYTAARQWLTEIEYGEWRQFIPSD